MGHGTNGTASGEGHAGTARPAHSLHRSASLPYQAPMQGAGGWSSSAKTAPAISSMTRATPVAPSCAHRVLGRCSAQEPATCKKRDMGGQLGLSTPTLHPTLPCSSPGEGVPKLT